MDRAKTFNLIKTSIARAPSVRLGGFVIGSVAMYAMYHKQTKQTGMAMASD